MGEDERFVKADEYFNDWGEPAFRRGDWKRAIEHYTSALTLVPNDPMFLSRRALTLESQYDDNLNDGNLLLLAEKDVKLAEKEYGETVPLWFEMQRCRLYRKLKRFDESLKIARSILSLGEEWKHFLPAHYQILFCFVDQQQWTQVLSELEVLISLEPSLAEHHQLKVLALQENKCPANQLLLAVDLAIDCLKQKRTKDKEHVPNLAKLNFTKAVALLDLNSPQEALTILEELVRVQNPYFELFEQVARAHGKMNNTKQQRNVLLQALQLTQDPDKIQRVREILNTLNTTHLIHTFSRSPSRSRSQGSQRSRRSEQSRQSGQSGRCRESHSRKSRSRSRSRSNSRRRRRRPSRSRSRSNSQRRGTRSRARSRSRLRSHSRSAARQRGRRHRSRTRSSRSHSRSSSRRRERPKPSRSPSHLKRGGVKEGTFSPSRSRSSKRSPPSGVRTVKAKKDLPLWTSEELVNCVQEFVFLTREVREDWNKYIKLLRIHKIDGQMIHSILTKVTQDTRDKIFTNSLEMTPIHRNLLITHLSKFITNK